VRGSEGLAVDQRHSGWLRLQTRLQPTPKTDLAKAKSPAFADFRGGEGPAALAATDFEGVRRC
jgi:hypothetical protein